MELEFRGVKFYFGDSVQGAEIAREIFSDNYKVFERGISLRPGDVVLDVGANEGMFSIMLAKIFPWVRIIALEPVQRTFFQMIRNIGLNGVQNIEAHNVGVGSAYSSMQLVVDKKGTTGGASGIQTYDSQFSNLVSCDIRPLDDFIRERIRLLKIDIEGMEYETLYASKKLDQVDYVVAEFHINKKLKDSGRDFNELATWVGSKSNLVFYDKCYMAE